MGCDSRSQPLKSPTTWTAVAAGAHTAKATPSTVPSGPRVALHMRAEHLPQLLVAALVEEEPVHLAERGREPVGVVLLVLDAVVVGDEQAVVLARGHLGGGPGPDAAAYVRQVEDPPVLQLRADTSGQRPVCRDGEPSGAEVVAEQVVRLRVASLEEGRDGALVGDHGSGCESGHLAPLRRELWGWRRRSTAWTGMPTQLGRLRAS